MERSGIQGHEKGGGGKARKVWSIEAFNYRYGFQLKQLWKRKSMIIYLILVRRDPLSEYIRNLAAHKGSFRIQCILQSLLC